MLSTFIFGSLTALVPIIIVGIYKLYIDDKIVFNFGTLLELFLFYGLTHTLLITYIKPYVDNYFIIGLMAGFIYSFLGRYYYQLPKNLWKMKNEWHIHIILPIIWGILYQFIFPTIEKILVNII